MPAQIPERIFKIASESGGIPFDFREDDDALVIILTDGRKIEFEKESGTKKRVQLAQLEQSKVVKSEAERAVAQLREELNMAEVALSSADQECRRLEALVNGKPAGTGVSADAHAKKKGSK